MKEKNDKGISDFETMKQILDLWGVEYTFNTLREIEIASGKKVFAKSICLESDTRRVNGYPLMTTLIEFTENGDFIEFGIWE